MGAPPLLIGTALLDEGPASAGPSSRTVPGMRRLFVVVLALVVLPACPSDGGGGGSDSGRSTSTTATSAAAGGGGSAPTSATTTNGAAAPSCPANTNPQAADAVTPRAELVAVRAAHQPGFDRVVFEFRGAAPGFRVEYGNKPVTEDGSGHEVALRGRHALYVRMDNASGWHFDDDGDDVDESGPTYTGPRRIRPGDTTVIRELVQAGDFEGVVTWAVGVDDRVGFRVSRLSGPPRLVVELCAAP